jgi:hypothetical protein
MTLHTGIKESTPFDGQFALRKQAPFHVRASGIVDALSAQLFLFIFMCCSHSLMGGSTEKKKMKNEVYN